MSDNSYTPAGGMMGGNVNVSFGGDAAPAASAPVKDITTQEFMSEVIEASAQMPVLVDFWAPWCGPCKQLAPALESAVAATRGRVKLVKMDIDQHPEVAGQMGIQSIPAVVAFVNGRPADMFMGAKPEGEIREFISKVAGPSDEDNQIEVALEHAAQLAQEGALEDAVNLYGQILSMDPNNLTALAAVGQIYIQEGNLEAANGLIANMDDDAFATPEIASLKTAIELAEQAASLGDHQELLDKLEADPKDHQTRLDLAIALNASGKREDAADHLLEIIAKQPGWNEDAAKTQLLQFFEAWGLTDEITVASRRRLSSLLFS